MNFYRILALLFVFLAIAPGKLKAQDSEKKPSLTDWLETTLGQDSSYIQEVKEINAENLLLIANTLSEKKAYQKAVEVYRKVLEEFNSADAAYNLGLTYEINLKNPSLALLYYSKFLSIEPDSPDARAVRSWIERIKKKKERTARQLTDEKKKGVPQSETATAPPPEKKQKEWAIRSGPPINEEEIPSGRQNTAKSFLRTGNEHFHKKRYEKAIEDFQSVLDYYDSTDAYYNIGVTYQHNLSNPQKAIPFYRRYLEVDSFSETAGEVKKFLEQAETSILMKKLNEGESFKVPAQ